MSLNFLSLVFKIIIIVIIYCIIFFALKIMYKDMKNGGKKKVAKKSIGLEIMEVSSNSNLKRGGVVPLRGEIKIGRNEENEIFIDDSYVSNQHARIFVKNNQILLEDLGSTNGTIHNGKKIASKIILRINDEIKIGKVVFKVIG